MTAGRLAGAGRSLAATWAVLLAAAIVLEGCAGAATERSAGPGAADAAAPPAAARAQRPVPAPLLPLQRLPPTGKADAVSLVTPVISDGAVDPEEDAVEPGIEFERGGASWYGSRFHGRRTASGERFDLAERTAAHRSLPFGSMVCVRNLANGRVVMVRVNDRGPSSRKRVIDISQAAADELAMVGMGIQTVALSRPVSGQTRCE